MSVFSLVRKRCLALWLFLYLRKPVPRPRRSDADDRLDGSALGERRTVRFAPLTSYYAVKVYGPGHVIAHNAIAYFHDAIGISTYGTPESDPERRASSIDIYNNDFHMLNDDFVETDGGVHNVRVFNNRGVNAFHGGYSSQPTFGGPIYFIGNILYHVTSSTAFKFSSHPAGLLVYHNTIINEHAVGEPYSNAHWRNNLFLSKNSPGVGVMTWANASDAYSTDYNGFRPNKGVERQYRFFAPPKGQKVYEA